MLAKVEKTEMVIKNRNLVVDNQNYLCYILAIENKLVIDNQKETKC